MSNLFLFQPKRGSEQQKENNFFSNQHGLYQEEEEEELKNDDNAEDFDDDKNDETFGDSAETIGKDWQATTNNNDAIAQFKNNLKQHSPAPSKIAQAPRGGPIEQNDFYEEDPEMLNSVIHQAIDDTDEESFVLPQQQPSGQFFLMGAKSSPWGNPYQNDLEGQKLLKPSLFSVDQEIPPQHQQMPPQQFLGSPMQQPRMQQPPQQLSPHHHHMQQVQQPQMMMQSPQHHAAYQQQMAAAAAQMSAEDFEAQLMSSYAAPPQQTMPQPIPQQQQAPPQQQEMYGVSPQKKPFAQVVGSPSQQPQILQTPPRQQQASPYANNNNNSTPSQPIQILQRQQQSPAQQQQQHYQQSPQGYHYNNHHHQYAQQSTPPKNLMHAFSSPEKKLGPVYNTYLLPSVQQGKNAPTYGYFPIYRKVFHDAEYMPADLIEDVVRQQMADLEISNPFLDDYYYCMQMNNKHQSLNPSKRLPPNFVQWVESPLVDQEFVEAEQQAVQLPRVFGRIPSNNVRAPRLLMQMDKNELSELAGNAQSFASLQKDQAVGIQMAIENGLSQLLVVEDACLCLRLGTGDNQAALTAKLNQACRVILDTFQLSFEKAAASKTVAVIASRAKGLKYLSKTLRVMPEPHSVLIIQACLLNWSSIIKSLTAHEEVLQKQFYKDLCQAISQLGSQALCPILNCINVNNGAQQGEKIWSSNEGRRVVSVLLNRGFELSKKEKMPDWKNLFTVLFDLLQPFWIAFAKNNQWEFLIDVAQHTNPTQKKNLSTGLAAVIKANEKLPQVKQFCDVLNVN